MKVLNISLVAIAAALLGSFTYFYFNTPDSNQVYYSMLQMKGSVTGVNGNSVFISGIVNSIDGKSEDKTIEFIVTNDTILRSNKIIITLEQIKSGKNFHPKTIIGTGQLSDLSPDTKIFNVSSKNDLSKTNKATAAEISYLIYEMPAKLR